MISSTNIHILNMLSKHLRKKLRSKSRNVSSSKQVFYLQGIAAYRDNIKIAR